jgi:hypothetical protein
MNIFQVINGNLIHLKKETVNTGSKNFFKVQFEFDSSWEEYSKLRFLEFYQNKDGQHYKVKINESGIANIPTKVLITNLPIYVGVVAENYDSTIIANTNFSPINVIYGANTSENQIVVEEEGDLFQLFAPDTSIRYLRIRNNTLEYSQDNKYWYKVSGAISGGGITEEEVVEIINEQVTPQIQETNEKLEVVESIAKGASVPLTFSNYEQLVTIFNNLPNNVYKEGQNANIITVGVPDLWIAYITENSVTYEYSTDEALIEEIRASGSVQIGYYKFAELETQKVNLTDYVKDTDYVYRDNANDMGSGIVQPHYYGDNYGVFNPAQHKGRFIIKRATNSDIKARVPSDYMDGGIPKDKVSRCLPICGANIDFAVIEVLTNYKGEALTEEQKTKIRTLLGL